MRGALKSTFSSERADYFAASGSISLVLKQWNELIKKERSLYRSMEANKSRLNNQLAKLYLDFLKKANDTLTLTLDTSSNEFGINNFVTYPDALFPSENFDEAQEEIEKSTLRTISPSPAP